jgi:hypothetical protein
VAFVAGASFDSRFEFERLRAEMRPELVAESDDVDDDTGIGESNAHIPARQDGAASVGTMLDSATLVFATRCNGDEERREVAPTTGSDKDEDDDDFEDFASNGMTSSAEARRTRARCVPK